MKKIQFRFYDFTKNLIKQVIRREDKNQTVYIFPTAASKKQAIREFQNQWDFSLTEFLTMEELKELMFFVGVPVLREDKRILSFYTALTDENKKFFKINHYFQAIELANEFFNLFEEFNEERVAEDAVQIQFFSENNAELIDWQVNTYRQLQLIKQQYFDFIQKKNFTDKIFIYKPDYLRLERFQEFDNFVFVNQFYYTNLEKYVIKTFAEQNKNVTIYYQLPEHYVNKETLDVSSFSLADILPATRPETQIVECSNAFSMFIAMLQKLDQYKQNKPKQRQYIVDVSFLENLYSGFLDYKQFYFPTGVGFVSSSIYKFLTTLHDLLNNLMYEKNQEKILIPIDTILNAVLTDPFYRYFHPDDNSREISNIRERVLDYLYSLIEFDNKYFDLGGHFFKESSKREEIQEIKNILRFIQRFLKIDSIKSFVDFIDTDEGVEIKKIMTSHEDEYSDLRDTFYQFLSMFNSIEDFDIVTDWDNYFNVWRPEIQNIQIATGVLQLFINSLKYKKYHYHFNIENDNRIHVTELQDTRNINYENIFIMNVVERELPHAQQTPFLFTEKQRQLLNLKTYQDVKFREKYYFMRLILSSKNVVIFTQNNIENNIEVSSFVEEIKLCFQIGSEKVNDQNYGEIFQQILSCSDYSLADKTIDKHYFFSIPIDVKNDFPAGNFNITQYALKSLRENPFAYYVEHYAKAGERTKEIETDFSGKLIGNIVHDVINECWRYLAEINAGPLFGYNFSNIDEHYIKDAIDKILNRQTSFYYRIPHNHTVIYFDEILRPIIQQGVQEFFTFLHDLGLSNRVLEIIPEKEKLTPDEQKYKTVIPSEDNDLGLSIRLRGRADLRIEIPDENKYLIFDYKTGGFQIEQLIIYELFYYLLEHPDWIDAVDSYFFQVITYEEKSLRKETRYNRQKIIMKSDLFDLFKQNIREILSVLKENGFSLPDQKSYLNLIPEVTRSDLFLTLKKMNMNG